MKNLLLLTLFCFVAVTAKGADSPEQIKKDNVQIGKGSTSGDKVLSFDTADGASNPKLSVEKVSKKLKYDQDVFQLGDSSTTDTKDIIFNGDNKKIRYDGTANELQYDGDLLSVGDGTNTNKSLKFNKGVSSPSLRYNSTTGKLEFSNDDTTFRAIGSGTGSGSGGINILANSSFEDPIGSEWVNVGGTFTRQDYATPTESNIKFARFVASGAGQYVESVLTVIPSFLGAGCQAQFEKYATITDGAWKLVVLDASANVLATQNFNQSGGATTFISTPLLSFPCPTVGNTAKVRIESLAAATIDFDLGYLGGNKNTALGSTLIHETFYASAPGSGAGGDIASITTIESTLSKLVNTPTVVSGNIQIIPKQQVILHLSAARQDTNNLTTIVFRKNGIVFSTLSSVVTSNSPGIGGGSVEISAGPSDTIVIDFSGQSLVTAYFGLSAKSVLNGDAVTSDQSGWFIDANIGGANPSLGNTVVASYTEITNATLDMVLNPGSSAAKIPCSSTNSSTGLTCSVGNESVGVVFTPPFAGYYDVCTAFSGQVSQNAGATTELVFQTVHTANNAQTILQEGKERILAFNSQASTNGTISFPFRNCGTFYFSDVSEKTVRLMFEQNVAGTVGGSSVYADRAGASGQRDIRITVRPSTMNFARPVLTGDQVTSPGQTKPVRLTANINAVGTVNSTRGGAWLISPCVVSDTSLYTCTFSTPFSVAPHCGTTASGSPTGLFSSLENVTGATTTNVQFRTAVGTTKTTGAQFVWCEGDR